MRLVLRFARGQAEITRRSARMQRQNGKAWIGRVAGSLGLLFLAATVLGAALLGDCYDDIRVSRAGSSVVNGTYTYQGKKSNRPQWCTSASCTQSIEWKSGKWTIVSGGQDMYYGCSCSLPKPTNWDVGPAGTAPTPRVDGGSKCRVVPNLTIVPAGEAGILDRGWPEGEVAPVVGELQVSAVYEVGETITGCVELLDPAGELEDREQIELIIWRVISIGEDFDKREAWDVRTFRYGPAREAYCFSILTNIPLNDHEWAPGYFDLRFNYPNDTQEMLRIQLVEPSPEDEG
jgi:hypothetical protein